MIWNSLENTVEEALALPEGFLSADLGIFQVQHGIDPDELLNLVEEVQEKKIAIRAASQAGIYVKAQKAGLLQEYGEFSVG